YGIEYAVTFANGKVTTFPNARMLTLEIERSNASLTPPTVPQNFRVVAQGVDSVTLQWDASTDDRGVAGYVVYRNGVVVGTPTALIFTDTGLRAMVAYVSTVVA